MARPTYHAGSSADLVRLNRTTCFGVTLQRVVPCGVARLLKESCRLAWHDSSGSCAMRRGATQLMVSDDSPNRTECRLGCNSRCCYRQYITGHTRYRLGRGSCSDPRSAFLSAQMRSPRSACAPRWPFRPNPAMRHRPCLAAGASAAARSAQAATAVRSRSNGPDRI